MWIRFVMIVLALAASADAAAAPGPLELTWMGWDADELGKSRAESAPDGVLDHHLRLQLALGAGRRVAAFELREELPAAALRWSTRDAKTELLVAELDGRRLAEGDTVAGDAIVDLYAHDIGQWSVHRGIIAIVTLADGSAAQRRFTLSWPPDTLVGRWEMHCQSSSPDAFEPITISGRIQFRVQPDGTLSGHFSSTPLQGERSEGGEVSGSVDVPGTRLTFAGKLEDTAPGRPLRGGGGFRFTESKDACSGDGVWRSR